MPIDRIHLIGAGGHGWIVADALLRSGWVLERIVARDSRGGLRFLDAPVVTPELDSDMRGLLVHVSVGANTVRAQLYARALAAGGIPLTVQHPGAVVSPSARLCRGCFIAAGSVVAPGAVIGAGTIVNHGAIVDHDANVGEYCHIAPNATLGGEVTLGDRVLIGAAAVILPGVSIAADAIVGAGAVVTTAIGAGTWVGCPARKLK